MENNDYSALINEKFDFLFAQYDFTMTKSTFDKLNCPVYRLTSPSENFLFLLGRGLCTILFWPDSDSEENALTTDWIYDYFNHDSSQKISGDLLAVGETENIAKCLTEHHNKILEMKDLLFSPNHDWWESAKVYVEKRIELMTKKYTGSS